MEATTGGRAKESSLGIVFSRMLSRESFIPPKRFEVETYWSFVPHWTTKINKQTPAFCRMSNILSSIRIETSLETTCGFWAQACPSAEQTIWKHQQAGYALGYRHYSNLLLPSKSSLVSVNAGNDSPCWKRERHYWGPLGKVDRVALGCRRWKQWSYQQGRDYLRARFGMGIELGCGKARSPSGEVCADRPLPPASLLAHGPGRGCRQCALNLCEGKGSGWHLLFMHYYFWKAKSNLQGPINFKKTNLFCGVLKADGSTQNFKYLFWLKIKVIAIH